MDLKDNKINTKSIIYIALFITLIYISSLIRLNVFSIPFTLQTLAVMLTACFLGSKKGLYVVMIYIFMGLVGLPVFTKGGGIFYIAEHTFGYIVAFIPAVIIIGLNKAKASKNIFTLILLLFASSIVMLVIGTMYAFILLSITSNVDLSAFLTGYFLLFMPTELLKSIAAAMIYFRLKKYI